MILLLVGRVRRGGWLLSGLLLCALAGASVASASDDGSSTTAAPDYTEAVQPIFNRRCIACHGCLGSPCNVKLVSYRGVERGGFGLNAYSDHFGSYPRTDMDAADSTQAWRKLGFYPNPGQWRNGERAARPLAAVSDGRRRHAPPARLPPRRGRWSSPRPLQGPLRGDADGALGPARYDTVAGFAYWEGDPKKLETLLFFNFLRQGFEDHFLLLLPEHYRQGIRDRWTRGIGQLGLYAVPFVGAKEPSRIAVSGDKPLDELAALIAKRLGPAISRLPDRLNPRIKPDVELTAPMHGFDDFERAISTMTAVDHRPSCTSCPASRSCA